MQGNTLKYLQLTRTWLARRATDLSEAEEAAYAAQLDEIWKLLSERERVQIQKALVEDASQWGL